MITDRELDAQLAGAAGVRDADLPALPDDFLRHVMADADAGPSTMAGTAASEPASVIAARQLVADAHGTRTANRLRPRRPSRKAVLRFGVAVVAIAAAWTTAVVVAPPDRPGTPDDGTGTPTDGVTLVATEQITFPLSLNPTPAGVTPTFTGGEGWGSEGSIADYRSADGTGFAVWVLPEKPDWVRDGYGSWDIVETGTATVGGADAEFVRGIEPNMCTELNRCADRPFADLIWERQPGQWVWIRGEDQYGDLAAVVAVAESLVDRPQPVTLQVGLAPAGWSVDSWHNSTDLTLVDDADPDRHLSVQALPPSHGWSVDQLMASVTAIDPVVSTTVNGRPAQLVHAHDYMDAEVRFWLLAWELSDGTLVTVTAPEEFTRDDVLAIAEQVTYTP